MQTATKEMLLVQITQLPTIEQLQLYTELGSRLSELAPKQKVRAVAPIDAPDYQEAFQWLVAHSAEYSGEWVALDGGRLIAHARDARTVYAAANDDGAYLPLVTQVEDPNAPPFAGF